MVKFQKRSYRKKRTTSKKMSVAKKASVALSEVRKLKRTRELKYSDAQFSAGVDSTGEIRALTGLVLGDAPTSRDGNMVTMQSIQLKGEIDISASQLNTQVTMILFTDKREKSDTNPSVTDVLTYADPNSFLNLLNRGRFKILQRRKFVLTDQRPSASLKMWSTYKHNIYFNDVASTDRESGTVYLLMISNQPTTDEPTITYNMRFRYTDA